MSKLTRKRKRLIEKAVKLVIKEYGETLRLLGKKKGGIPDSLAAAFSIANQGRVGDVVGFTVGKKHFTLIKDTGYVTQVRLEKLKKEGGDEKREIEREILAIAVPDSEKLDDGQLYAQFYIDDLVNLFKRLLHDRKRAKYIKYAATVFLDNNKETAPVFFRLPDSEKPKIEKVRLFMDLDERSEWVQIGEYWIVEGERK